MKPDSKNYWAMPKLIRPADDLIITFIFRIITLFRYFTPWPAGAEGGGAPPSGPFKKILPARLLMKGGGG